MATTGGQAGWNLCGRSAAGLASSRFGCGGREASFLGVASDSASLWLENHACAPPLLQRIGVVGGAVVTLRRVMQAEEWRARKKAWSASKCIAVSEVCAATGLFGWAGGLEEPGNRSKRLRSFNRREARLPSRHISVFQAARCWRSLYGSQRTILTARLLQSRFRRQCRPASAAVGVLQG